MEKRINQKIIGKYLLSTLNNISEQNIRKISIMSYGRDKTLKFGTCNCYDFNLDITLVQMKQVFFRVDSVSQRYGFTFFTLKRKMF